MSASRRAAPLVVALVVGCGDAGANHVAGSIDVDTRGAPSAAPTPSAAPKKPAKASVLDLVLGMNGHIVVLKYDADFPEYRDVLVAIRREKGIRAAAPFTEMPMVLLAGVARVDVIAKGLDPDSSFDVVELPKFIVEGSLTALRAPTRGAPAPSKCDGLASVAGLPGVAIGTKLAAANRLAIGACVEASPSTSPTRPHVPRARVLSKSSRSSTPASMRTTTSSW